MRFSPKALTLTKAFAWSTLGRSISSMCSLSMPPFPPWTTKACFSTERGELDLWNCCYSYL